MSARAALPLAPGLGLRAPHHREVLLTSPPVAWWEVHSENFFAESGVAADFLQAIAAKYPLSVHGVGASLGGVDTLFERHLDRLARLVERVAPAAVSEHLCWSAVDGRHFNDLLPLPYTDEALTRVADRVDRLQNRLRRTILVENVASYLVWRHADYREWDFLAALARKSGCGILLDLNNIYVAACNHGFDADDYLAAMPAERVGEYHLAGFEACADEGDTFLVDTHGSHVAEPVWALYRAALASIGPRPTLIEWDTAIPALATLRAEAARAGAMLAAPRQMPSAKPPLARHAAVTAAATDTAAVTAADAVTDAAAASAPQACPVAADGAFRHP